VKVCKPDGDGTVSGRRCNGGDAPIPAIGDPAIELAVRTDADIRPSPKSTILQIGISGDGNLNW
jgi:hypothetical protein